LDVVGCRTYSSLRQPARDVFTKGSVTGDRAVLKKLFPFELEDGVEYFSKRLDGEKLLIGHKGDEVDRIRVLGAGRDAARLTTHSFHGF
jgi:hypothetical protein